MHIKWERTQRYPVNILKCYPEVRYSGRLQDFNESSSLPGRGGMRCKWEMIMERTQEMGSEGS